MTKEQITHLISLGASIIRIKNEEIECDISDVVNKIKMS